MGNRPNNIDEKLWCSIDEYFNNSEVVGRKAHEFLNGVTDDFEVEKISGMSRRKFLALLTASAAVSVTACSDYRDKGEIIPYTNRPEEILPGKANYYASTCNGCEQACGILIKTREGRPIKIEGNPDHPINQGKICSKGESSILNLYDPERLREASKNGKEISWESVDSEIIEKLKSAVAGNKEIAIVTHSVNSPTTKKLLGEFVNKYPKAKVYSYELFDNQTRKSAWQKCYGNQEIPAPKFDKAKIILSLDADFLGRDGFTIENTRLFAQGNNVNELNKFNRLYSVEGGMSLTGMNSDYRLRLRPDRQFNFVMGLISELIKRGKINSTLLSLQLKQNLMQFDLSKISDENGLDQIKLSYLLDDLESNGPESIVFAGDTLSENVHIAVNLLNELLGNDRMFNYENSIIDTELSTSEEWNELAQNIDGGNVAVMINFNANPVYHVTEKFGLNNLDKIPTKISLVESANETSAICDYVLPVNHGFESWGDAYVRDGIYSLQQPVIAPIFDTRQKESILLNWLNEGAKYSEDIYHLYLQNSFKEKVYDTQNIQADFKSYWYSALHDGVINLSEGALPKSDFDFGALINTEEISIETDYVIQLQPSYFIGDGRFANNGWLQELPHPVSKVTWDNYAALSPQTAAKFNVANDDVIEIKVGDEKVKLPVLVQPGIAEGLITVELGYGRSVVGDVGKDTGVNANSLLRSDLSFVFGIDSIKKTGEQFKLASTQEHHALDDTLVKDFHKIRKIIQEGTLEEYKADPKFLHHSNHEIFSITDELEYKGNKWAMAIDLNKCTGCNACVAACNVENNVPVVGKDQVANGREMHWMRIDRYYSGSPENPSASNQPMLCQHCDNAPCENVCPVNATNHSPDGLNQMAYNRCVGTRYCANNCPYKVRRFNFFNFRDHFAGAYYENELTQLANNPEVTVRSRGVMEKCTFCVHKIMEAREEAIKDGRKVRSEDITTACQQACPSRAIEFGDANESNSKIVKYRKHDLSYHVLEELNVKPNVTYIAKLRNTRPEDAK